jgi:hypothetical protein
MRVINTRTGMITSLDVQLQCLEPYDIDLNPIHLHLYRRNLILTFIVPGIVCGISLDDDSCTRLCGTGVSGFSGDEGRAVDARLNFPVATVSDANGDLFVADSNNFRVRRISSTGHITTVVGTGVSGYLGDGGAASSAAVGELSSLCLDAEGNLLLVDIEHSVVRQVNRQTGVISTAIGNGDLGYSGDGGPATSCTLRHPSAICVDLEGNIIIADGQNYVVRMVEHRTRIITTIAGTGERGYSGDGHPATTALLNDVSSLAIDVTGNILLADSSSCVIRELNRNTGMINRIAGTGRSGRSGDGGPALAASIEPPVALAVDDSGTLFIAEAGRVLRRTTNASNPQQVRGRPGGHRDGIR